MVDRALVHDTLQKSEETRQLEVVRIGIPEVVGFHRDGEPVWSVDGKPNEDWHMKHAMPVIRGGGEGYHNTQIEPITADQGSITLATTQKALWPYAATLVPANFFSAVGRTVHIKAFGKATTDGTAGNYVAGIGYGSSDAPTALAAGVARAGITGVSNISWIAEAYYTCRLVGASGTLVGWGQFTADLALMLSTVQPNVLPGSALVAVTVDTTAGTNSPVITLQRSGVGVWTATTQAIVFSALN